MNIDFILTLAALIFMLLAAFGVSGRVSWFHLSLACLIATLLV